MISKLKFFVLPIFATVSHNLSEPGGSAELNHSLCFFYYSTPHSLLLLSFHLPLFLSFFHSFYLIFQLSVHCSKKTFQQQLVVFHLNLQKTCRVPMNGLINWVSQPNEGRYPLSTKVPLTFQVLTRNILTIQIKVLSKSQLFNRESY